MKIVHTKSMVAHLWANQAQPTARTGNGSFFFEGKALYSYGYHYCAGFITPWLHDGKTVVLINSNHYSSTTNRHVAEARRALRGHTDKIIFPVCDITRGSFHCSMAGSVLDQCRETIKENLERLENIRADWKIAQALENANTAFLLGRIASKHIENGASKNTIKEFEQLGALIPKECDKASIKALTEKLKQQRQIKQFYADQDLLTRSVRRMASAIMRKGEFPSFIDDISPSDPNWLANWSDILNEATKAIGTRKGIDTISKKYNLRKTKGLPTIKLLENVREFADDKNRQEWLQTVLRHSRNALLVMKHGNLPFPAHGFLPTAYEKASAKEKHLIDLARKTYARKQFGRQLAGLPERVQDITEALEHAKLIELSHPNTAKDTYKRALSEFARIEKLTENLSDKSKSFFIKNAPLSLLDRAKSFVETFEALQIERNRKVIADWRNCVGTMTSVRHLMDFPLCRYNAEKKRLETSYGAEMPKAHAMAVWLAIQKAKRQGADYIPTLEQAEKMGAFKLSLARVDGSIVAGCHDIPASEIEYIAGVLGYLNDNVTTIEGETK